MKRLAVLLLALAPLAACGGDADDNGAVTSLTAQLQPASTAAPAATEPSPTTAAPVTTAAPTTTAAPEPEGPPDDFKASPAVWADIQAMSDCGELQAMFDQASENFDIDGASSFAKQASSSIMEAVDKRMRKVDCY